MSTSGGSGGGALTATAHLTGPAIATLFSAPTIIVPAAPAGHAIIVESGWTQSIIGATEWLFVAPGCFYGPTFPIQGEASQPFGGLIGAQQSVGRTQVFEALATSRPPATATVDGAPIIVADSADPTQIAPIDLATLNAGGTGYAIGDTGVIVGVSSDATYVVDTVDLITGAVLTFHLTSAGTQYTLSQNPQATATGGAQPGVGVNFTVDVTLAPPDGDLWVTVYYHLITLH